MSSDLEAPPSPEGSRPGYPALMAVSQIPVDEITARAREVRFSRVALTLIMGFFYVIGRAAGFTWVGVVICALAVRRGWREGQGITDPPGRRLSEVPRI